MKPNKKAIKGMILKLMPWKLVEFLIDHLPERFACKTIDWNTERAIFLFEFHKAKADKFFEFMVDCKTVRGDLDIPTK